MKPILIKPITFANQAFTIEEQKGPHFNYPFHYHPEFEITLITEGKGTRFVGNSIERFKEGDLVLIGKNLPHEWKCDKEYYHIDSKLITRSIVLKFDSDLKGTHLFDLPENIMIRKLLNTALRGISFSGKTKIKVSAIMKKLVVAKGSKRILLLLNILNKLSESADIVILNNEYHAKQENNLDRMNNVYDYINKNHLGFISLPHAAYIANMHTSAFCRYFKKRHGKTFIQVVNEMRINHACNKLINSDINVGEVCYVSGFNNLSNFTKMFKKIMGVSPKEYKNKQLNEHMVA